MKVCTHYLLSGKKIDFFPANIEEIQNCKPVYKDFKGWNKIDKDSVKFMDLPKEAQEYLKFIEKELKTPIAVISIGPGRKETIEL